MRRPRRTVENSGSGGYDFDTRHSYRYPASAHRIRIVLPPTGPRDLRDLRTSDNLRRIFCPLCVRLHLLSCAVVSSSTFCRHRRPPPAADEQHRDARALLSRRTEAVPGLVAFSSRHPPKSRVPPLVNLSRIPVFDHNIVTRANNKHEQLHR